MYSEILFFELSYYERTLVDSKSKNRFYQEWSQKHRHMLLTIVLRIGDLHAFCIKAIIPYANQLI